MSNSWFRLYAEFAVDHKVQMMSETDQRRLVMLFCMRCSNGDVTLHDTEIAFHLRVTSNEWNVTKVTFIEKGFIDEDNNILNWNKRQFISDSSAERVRTYRARRKEQLKLKRNCNVTVTPPDTDTDTDTEIYTTTLPRAREENLPERYSLPVPEFDKNHMPATAEEWQQFFIERNGYQIHIVKKVQVMEMLIGWTKQQLTYGDVLLTLEYADAKLGQHPDSPLYYQNFVKEMIKQKQDEKNGQPKTAKRHYAKPKHESAVSRHRRERAEHRRKIEESGSAEIESTFFPTGE